MKSCYAAGMAYSTELQTLRRKVDALPTTRSHEDDKAQLAAVERAMQPHSRRYDFGTFNPGQLPDT
jgi:hypothetical protein